MNGRNPELILLFARLVTTLLILGLGHLPLADASRAVLTTREGHAGMEP
ncbi:hypothetical protein [Deinococcus hopiensis]|uniref:Uncharacterized protein n=1 Tax=Deinococcus hopiensis KR-140 TaxID=695939 RepID=A0A1W1UA03_9DEIO|nr:hypothetical protein [Deinococcus hopiensis]SMB77897.1 hypothetical protein SAMN00790413_03989 [Deinococcus hopiensis KR-140]